MFEKPSKKAKSPIETPSQPERRRRFSAREIRFVIRILIGGSLAFLAYTIAKAYVQCDDTIWDYRCSIQYLAAVAAALIGFFLIPLWLLKVKQWAETLIIRTVTDIVSNFWSQQTSRMSDARKDRATKKEKDTEKRLAERLKNSILVDTSVLIDGRVVSLAEAGFILRDLSVLKSVVNELHLLSDSGFDDKRKKGRRGLDNLATLKKHVKVFIPSVSAGNEGADSDLVEVAKKYEAKVLTLDFNLNKVAKVNGVKVLNINELMEALKQPVLPNEVLRVKIAHEGKEQRQGIGYLDDGTMVVIEGAREKVGEELEVVVSKVIQTQAGRMLFCKVK